MSDSIAIASSAASHFSEMADSLTRSVGQGENKKTDNAIKIVSLAAQTEVEAQQMKTVEDLLSQLL